ncbi:MAG: TatD family hydrolase [Methanobrevibacter sp. CfCl-M3]
MIDTHCHLDFENFNKDREETIKRSEQDLTALINSGTSFEGNIRTLQLSKEYDGFIYPSFGFHPLQSTNKSFECVDKVLSQTTNCINEIVAIGEVGMDFFYVKDKLQRDKQIDIFKKFCNFANEYQKPVLIHCRDAEKKALNIVNQFDNIPSVVFHCYSGSLKTAKKIEDIGYFMSASTMIEYSKKHQELFSEISLDNILTETDSPYLHPSRGKRNEPSFVSLVIDKIAELKEIEVSVVNKITEDNAKNVFNI